MLRKGLTRFVFFLVITACMTTTVYSGQNPEKLFKRYENGIVRVEYFKNVTANSEIGNYVKKKQYRIGLVVRSSGIIMVSNDVYPLSLDILSAQGGSFFSAPPTDFKVTLPNGKSYPAEFLGKDDQAEVAFLKAQLPPDSTLDSVTFSFGKEAHMGEKIYLLELLSKKYDFAPLFTPTHVNAVIRKPRLKYIVDHVTPSLSAGGLVIDSSGNAIGITLKPPAAFDFSDPEDFGAEGGNIYTEIAPADWFKSLIANPPILKNSRKNGKPWLGIRMQALTTSLKKFWKIPFAGGVVVDKVLPESPAEKAGLQPRDIILAVNNKAVYFDRDQDLQRFREMVINLLSHHKAAFKIFRNGKTIIKNIMMEPAPPSIDLSPKLELPDLGFEVREITRDVLYQNNLPLNTRGLYVFRVDFAAPAGLAGLQIGQIITEVDQNPVRDLQGFKKIIKKSMEATTPKVLLKVLDRHRNRFVFIEKNK